MSAIGTKRTLRHVHLTSALPPKADMDQHGCDVRFVPKADIPRCGRDRRYSITSSAATRKLCGTVMPSAFAVFKFISSSNFSGWVIGRSPGAVPFKILSTYQAADVLAMLTEKSGFC